MPWYDKRKFTAQEFSPLVDVWAYSEKTGRAVKIGQKDQQAEIQSHEDCTLERILERFTVDQLLSAQDSYIDVDETADCTAVCGDLLIDTLETVETVRDLADILGLRPDGKDGLKMSEIRTAADKYYREKILKEGGARDETQKSKSQGEQSPVQADSAQKPQA